MDTLCEMNPKAGATDAGDQPVPTAGQSRHLPQQVTTLDYRILSFDRQDLKIYFDAPIPDF